LVEEQTGNSDYHSGLFPSFLFSVEQIECFDGNPPGVVGGESGTVMQDKNAFSATIIRVPWWPAGA